MERLIISFIDTETAGLPKDMKAPYSDTDNWPYLLSFGVVTVHMEVNKNGLILSSNTITEREFIRCYDKDVVNPPEAMAINGITPELQKEKGVSIPYLMEWVRDSFELSDLIVSHNTEFDAGVLHCELYRYGIPAMPVKRWFCTKEDIGDITGLPATEKQRAYRPNVDYKLLSLDELYQHLFGKPIENRETHGALKDAKACAQCFFRLNQQGRIKL